MPATRVVLYQPPYQPDTAGAIKPVAPLALLHLAAALHAADLGVEIVDAQVEADALARLRALTPGVAALGITAMTGYQIRGALAASEAARRTAPEVPIVWGGWHPSLCPEETATDPLVDVVVRGPGERTLVELVRRQRTGQPWDDVLRITYRRGNDITSTPDRPIEGPDPQRQLPFEKLRMECYGGRRLFGEDWGANFSPSAGQPFAYISSSGCSYRCRFCAATKVYRRRWCALPVEKTLEELEELHRRYRIEILSFLDPEFFIDTQRAEAIMRGILARGLRIFWKAQVRPEHVVRLGLERMRLAYASGCRQLEIGAESGSPSVLAMIQKDSTPEAALESAVILRAVGITGQYNLMFGFPRETEADVRATFRFAAALKRTDPQCLIPMYYFAPHPGIPLEDEARAHGYTPPTSLRAWAAHECAYAAPRMPWIRRPRQLQDRILRTITFYLPLAFPGNVTRGTLRHVRARLRRWPDALWLWPAHALARLRVVLDCYAWPWEWWLFNAVRRIGRSVRRGRRVDFLRRQVAVDRVLLAQPAAQVNPLTTRATERVTGWHGPVIRGEPTADRTSKAGHEIGAQR